MPAERPPVPSRRTLWTCPRCGARFVTRNVWHSWGRATLAAWKARMGPRERAPYRRFERLIAACGPYEVAPAKTRIAWWVHRLRITDPAQLDGEVQAWLCRSYRLVGMRERLGGAPRGA